MTVKGIVSNVMVVIGMVLMSSSFYWLGKIKAYSEVADMFNETMGLKT